jgi:hypothetical protein
VRGSSEIGPLLVWRIGVVAHLPPDGCIRFFWRSVPAGIGRHSWILLSVLTLPQPTGGEKRTGAKESLQRGRPNGLLWFQHVNKSQLVLNSARTASVCRSQTTRPRTAVRSRPHAIHTPGLINSRLRRHSPRWTRIRLLTNTTSTRLHSSLSLIRRRAKRTDFVDVDADGFVVLAEDDARDFVACVLGADVGVQRDVRGAFEVVGVLVEAHCSVLLRWVDRVGGVGGSWKAFGGSARLVTGSDRCCCGLWLSC